MEKEDYERIFSYLNRTIIYERSKYHVDLSEICRIFVSMTEDRIKAKVNRLVKIIHNPIHDKEVQTILKELESYYKFQRNG